MTFSFLFLIGCSKDDNVGSSNINSEPEFMEVDQEISSLPGRQFTINATISDPAGIEFVNLKYEPWNLDKTIEKDSLPTTYNLRYAFQVPAEAQENSEHIIKVTSTNIGGKSTNIDVKVTLDLDNVKPGINLNRPANGATVLINDGNEIDFEITVTDEELAQFKIESELLNEIIEISGMTYTYSNSLNVEETGTYTFTVSTTDATGNVNTQQITVNVLDELKFDKMYITNVVDASKLTDDIFGVPALAEASKVEGEVGYVFTARYYADEPNTELRFVPQKSSFEPYTLGADPEEDGKLINGSSPDVNPIVLPDKGYYEITMDLKDMSYVVTSYTPTDDTYDFVQIIGTGVEVEGESTCVSNIDGSNTCWHFKSGKELTQDSENPYRFSGTVKLFDEPSNDGDNGFILNANPDGWGPFWRFDDDNAVPGGGVNFTFTEEEFGTYKFVLDTHLNRLTITPIN